MANIYSASNYGVPVGRVADYNNTHPSHAITSFRAAANVSTPITVSGEPATDFASAVYQDGPYSLEHPNQKSEILAQNVDYIA